MTRRHRGGRSTGNFFRNWRESDLPLHRKVIVAFRNRSSYWLAGNLTCCGHPGEPGC